MNLSQYYKVVRFVVKAYQQGGIENAYQNVINALQNQINSPNEGHLEQLSNALEELKNAVGKADFQSMPPTWKPLIDELDLSGFIGDVIHTWVRERVTESGPVLTEAQKKIQRDFEKLKETYRHLSATNEALEYLDYPTERLSEGEAEILILLPRELFNDEVGNLASRLKLFDQIVLTCSEVATGSAEKIKLKEISTTDPLLVAIATPATVLFVLKAVNQILDAYKKVVEIREIQARTKAIGMEDKLVKQIGAEAEKIINEKIQEFIDAIKKERKLKNELAEKLKLMVGRLAAMIDHGARVEGWAIPVEHDNDSEEEDTEAPEINETLEEIREIGRQLRQFSGQGEPILNLPPPNDEEKEQ